MPWFLYLPMHGILSKGWTAEDGGASGTWKVSRCTKGVKTLLEGLCSKEGKVGDGFVLVIRISIWNHMHFGSVPCNNESLIFHSEDKCHKIVALDIVCTFNSDSGFWTSWGGGESWYYLEGGGVTLWIPLFLIQVVEIQQDDELSEKSRLH